MYRPIGIFVVALVGVTGVAGLMMDRANPSDRLIQESSQRPVFDPDDHTTPTFEDDKPRIDRFAQLLKENKSAEGYIIAYGGVVSYKNEAKTRLNCTQRYLTAVHKIPRSRLKLIDGGYRVEVTVAMFVVQPRELKPEPYSPINPEAAQIKKTPKWPCGKTVLRAPPRPKLSKGINS